MLKPVVKQSVLRAYLRRMDDVDTYHNLLKEAEALAAALEMEITKLLEEGAPVEPGKCKALLNEVIGPRRPPWKEVFLNHMNTEHDERPEVVEKIILDGFPPKTKQVLVVTKA